MIRQVKVALAVLLLMALLTLATIAALPVLTAIANARYVRGLYAQLRSPRADQRAEAITALAIPTDRPRDLAPALHALQTDRSSEVREAAAFSLGVAIRRGGFGTDAEALRIYSALLTAMTEDSNREVRVSASGAALSWLWELERGGIHVRLELVRSTSEPSLQKALRDPDSEVRQNAKWALERVKRLEGKPPPREQHERHSVP